jgi:hypothetical protein
MNILFNRIIWYPYQGACLPEASPHHPISLNSKEQKILLKLTKSYFLRWTTHFDTPTETPFWYIIKDSNPSLEELSANTRSKVRRGLKNCSVTRTDKKIIIHEGYEVYIRAFNRYATFQQPLSKSEFQNNITSLGNNWEFWSVRNSDNALIAYSQNHLQENTCNYSTIKFDPYFLSLYPAYALFFTMNMYYLDTLKLDYVHDGARSIVHRSNIHDFLCNKFNFRKAYCRLHLSYRWDIALLIRLLYPFRNIFSYFKNSITTKLSIVLFQETIRRECE